MPHNPVRGPRPPNKRVSASLPEFPWDTLADAKALAGSHPDGIVDLSIGTPVDPVAPLIQDALAAAGSASGYPATAGTARLRESAAAALDRRFAITGLTEAAVLPVIGSKELIAWLPTLLGLGPADVVVVPELAYPTYDVGARLAGAQVLRADSLTQVGPRTPALVYLNSPGNPTGRVLGVDHLRKVVGWARDRGVVVASDECYLGLGWDVEPPGPLSVLHPSVCDGDHTGLLAIHSLSKSSSLAGYRAGFVAGDPVLIAELLAGEADECEDETANVEDDAELSDAESFTLKDKQLAINETHPFGIRIWKPALYKKDRSVEKTAEEDIHSSPSAIVSNWLWVFNCLWTVLFGWWLALAALLAAAVCLIFGFEPSARKYSRVLQGLSRYLLYPFG